MFLTINFGKIKRKIFWGAAIVGFAALVVFIGNRFVKKEDISAFSEKTQSVLVIDPGHGGTDGGAVSENGTKESEINLAIGQRMKALSGLLGIETIMTRDSEKLDYPEEADTLRKKKVYDQKQRVSQINNTQNAVLLSIHQNIYPNNKPRGPQVLYAATEDSDRFAAIAQQNLLLVLPDNVRTASQIDSSIYLMKQIHCPAILVECGFLSNAEDEYLLKTEEYQKKLSLILLCSYLQYQDTTCATAG